MSDIIATAPSRSRLVSLRELCLKTTLTNPEQDPNRLFTYIDVSSVSNKLYQVTEANQILGKDAPSRARKLIHTNDVIFATVRPTLRRIALIPVELDHQVCSTGFCVLRADEQELDPSYLYFYLLTDRIGKQVENLQKGATYPAINDSDLLDQLIPLPPLPEQRAIARALRAVQDARAARQREAALERERKAALMQHLFTHGTRDEPRQVTAIGEVPASWRVVKLRDAIDIVQGQVNPTQEPYRSMLNVGPENIRSGTGELIAPERALDLGLSSGKYLFSAEHVLYSKIRPYLKKVALPNFIGICSADMYPLRPRSGVLLREFLFHLLLSDQFTNQAIASQDRTGIPKINREQLGSIVILLPSLEEQREIATVLTACDSRIAGLGREAARLEELFRALLEELMTGRLSAVPLIPA